MRSLELEPDQVTTLLSVLKGESDSTEWITRLEKWLYLRDKQIQIWNHFKDWATIYVREHEPHIYQDEPLEDQNDEILDRVYNILEYNPFIWRDGQVEKNQYINQGMTLLKPKFEAELLEYLNKKRDGFYVQ